MFINYNQINTFFIHYVGIYNAVNATNSFLADTEWQDLYEKIISEFGLNVRPDWEKHKYVPLTLPANRTIDLG